MEDPIRFELWCECERANRAEIEAYLGQLPFNPTIAGPDSKRLIGRRMLIKFHGRSWRIVEAIRAKPAPWLVRLTVYQESYGPGAAATLHYCGLHDLTYAGLIGCHVCTGFYEGKPNEIPDCGSV